MAKRPVNLDLNHHEPPTGRQPPNFHMDLPSPRMAGVPPPALSPLDAFALQSRMLAKQLEKEARERRASRLPHLTVARELANRPDYFRSASGGSEGALSNASEAPEAQEDVRPVTRGGLSEVRDRPMSHYPMLGRISRTGHDAQQASDTPSYHAAEDRQEPGAAPDYFGVSIPRASSPESVDPKYVNIEAPSPQVPSLTHSYDSAKSSQPRTFTNESTRSLHSERGLAPPQSPVAPRSQRSFRSIHSAQQDSGDEDGVSSYSGSHVYASSRKFSGSNSRPQSPFSPQMQPAHRSPSITSDYSINGTQPRTTQARPSFSNFSRPMSGAGHRRILSNTEPVIGSGLAFETIDSRDTISRHVRNSASTASAQSSVHEREDGTPAPPPSECGHTADAEPTADDGHFVASDPAPSSYIYAKYALPRGRPLDRDSVERRDSWIERQFSWDEMQSSPAEAEAEELLADSPPNERSRRERRNEQQRAVVRDNSPSANISGSRLSRKIRAGSDAQSQHSRNTSPQVPIPQRPSPSAKTESTTTTIRAASSHQKKSSAELTPDEHLEIGIQLHTAGQLNKSTYHLRLAAKAGLPTAMLLYALACRHGWGMRPSPEDGVYWLRRALEGSEGLDIATLEETVSSASRKPKADPVAEAAERHKRKTQFALAIYELGISYMNGWGVEKDKALALKCYEKSGSWGDCDALAEAGYCYVQGVGCKKDMYKAAELYRKAAEGGMSMAGQSWIWKPKYMAADPTSKPSRAPEQSGELAAAGEKVGRPRGRSIWKRK